MTNEPVVTQEDRNAAMEYKKNINRVSLMQLFAKHRTAAVAKREAEIRDKFLRVFDAAVACASVVTGYEKRINAVEQFDELRAAIRQLQTGGGA